MAHNVTELNQLYQEAESALTELFAEQRSNLLLVSGNHYARRGSRMLNQVRRLDNVDKTQKIRLTKNHIQKISKTYVNNLLMFAPGVSVEPKHKGERSDQIAAEENNSIWHDTKERHKLKSLNRKLARDFIDIGESFVKVFWDPNAGSFQGYEPEMDDQGLPAVSDEGDVVAKKVFTGDFVFERILGFNLITDHTAKSWEECQWVCYRKMLPVKHLKGSFKDDEEKSKMIQESADKTYMVFDGPSGAYRSGKDLCMIREYFFRPCVEYPKGYYYITTEAGILYQGELPMGMFPIVYVGFDEVPTSSRSYSIIKQLRPYQAEINRAASKIAEHQITLGDDKLILQNGGSISPGGTAHGVKAIKVTGAPPTILGGRSGEQFVGYLNQQITEMYQVSNVLEDSQETTSQLDPYAMLFRNMREKKKFSLYAEKWEEFLKEQCRVTLMLAKHFLPDSVAIQILGKKDQVRIAEWKKKDDLSLQIILEPSSEDIETKMGRQLALNHIVQYAGQSMNQQDLGKLLRCMPYVNDEATLSDLTLDYDSVTNDILRIERGQMPPPRKYENHQYVVQRLTARTKEADYEFLPPQVQALFEQKIQMHEKILEEQAQQQAAANAGFIPSGGYLVACDFYIPDNQDPSKLPKRARIPSEALQWLLDRLSKQGSTQQMLGQLPQASQADMAQRGNGPGPRGVAPQMGAPQQQQPHGRPQMPQRPVVIQPPRAGTPPTQELLSLLARRGH